MSLRTLERRFARSRAVAIWAFWRESSVRCWVRISRWRARLVDFRAEGVDSESRVRASCWRRAERWAKVCWCELREEGEEGHYLFEELV